MVGRFMEARRQFDLDQEFVEGQWYQASNVEAPPNSRGTGAILAVDPTSAETKWRFDLVSTPSAGILATAGGLVFTGDRQGYLIAFDDRTGKVLWKFQAGGPIVAPPISYSLQGKTIHRSCSRWLDLDVCAQMSRAAWAMQFFQFMGCGAIAVAAQFW